MARSKTVIDTAALQGIINKLESETQYKKRGDLFMAAAAKYTETVGKKISSVMIATRFDELQLTCKTVKSTRGRPKSPTTPTASNASNPTKIKSMVRVEVAGPEADMDADPDPIETQ